MADVFLEKTVEFVEKQKKDTPFFLYYALQQPHVPRTPHERFVGSSGMGPRGDVIVEADWCIGELIKTLDKQNLLGNTLIILSSDNGPVLNDGYYDDAVEKLGDHQPFGPLRGGKYSLFEAGTRVPFITYWKGNIQPKESDAMVSQVDLMASLARLIDSEETKSDGIDLLDTFMGRSDEGRQELIIEANRRIAYRVGDWVMIPPYKGVAKNELVNIELGVSNEYQLYNLRNDIGQKYNLAKTEPVKLTEMIEAFQEAQSRINTD